MQGLIACMFAFHELRTLCWPPNGCFWVFPLSVCIHSHTLDHSVWHPDGGHQVWQATSTTEKCVGFLPPGSSPIQNLTKRPSKVPMHNMIISSVTNILGHHTIQKYAEQDTPSAVSRGFPVVFHDSRFSPYHQNCTLKESLH